MFSEILTRLLNKEELEGKLKGIKISHNSPSVTHLMYADDLLVTCRANLESIEVFRHNFDKYCTWSGQAINFDKSQIFFSPRIKKQCKNVIKRKLGFKELTSSSIYLGNHLVLGRNRSKEFGKLKERVQARMEGWKNHLLSCAGKATLIKSVIQAIPQYSMSTFRIPDSVLTI